MPFILILIGILMLVAGIRNKSGQLIATVGDEFSGPGNFFYWIVALLLIGSLGYIDKVRPVSDALLALIIVALLLGAGKPTQTGGGVFTQLQAALTSTQTPSAPSITGNGTAATLGSIASSGTLGTFGGT